jgi:hypothetical protein
MKLFKSLLVVLALVTSTQAATLLWDSNPEPDIAGYQVHISNNGVTNVVTLGKVTSHNLTNLVAGRSYVFRVSAFNTANLSSELSDEFVSFTPALGTPPAPVANAPTVIAVNGNWNVSMSWQASPSQYAVDGYVITVLHNSTVYTNINVNGLSANFTVPQFSPTVITLKAKNYIGESAATTVATVSAPGKSRNLRIVLP